MNKSLFIYFLIFLIVSPTLSFNFLIHFLGNIILLIFLVPLLLFLISFLSFNSLKSKINVCEECGNILLGLNVTCVNCGSKLGDFNSKNFENLNKPSETTIEVQAEEIK